MSTVSDDFLVWQCRIRRHAVRSQGGRPSTGMQPQVALEPGTGASTVTVLLIEKDPADSASMFRHIVRQSPDPKQRYEKGIKLLAAEFYEDPERFRSALAALFTAESETAKRLARGSRCIMNFQEDRRRYCLPATVEELDDDDPIYQATYWHNRLFSVAPPPAVRVLAFYPDWERAGVAQTERSDA